MPLLWYIRDSLDLTGGKFGCVYVQCLHDAHEQPPRALFYTYGCSNDANVTTIEGIDSSEAKAIQTAWENRWFSAIVPIWQVMQANPKQSDVDIDAALVAVMSQLGRPDSLQWSREDDVKAGRYRLMTCHTVWVSMDADKISRAGNNEWYLNPFWRCAIRRADSGGYRSGLAERTSTLPIKSPTYR